MDTNINDTAGQSVEETKTLMYSKDGKTYPLGEIAMACHNENREYCLSIGDDSQSSWEDAPRVIQDSILQGVVNHIEDPEMTPEQSHGEWCKYKLAEGWKYGDVKSIEDKTHPCLLEYNSLSEAQQKKDHIFTQVVKDYMGTLNNLVATEINPESEGVVKYLQEQAVEEEVSKVTDVTPEPTPEPKTSAIATAKLQEMIRYEGGADLGTLATACQDLLSISSDENVINQLSDLLVRTNKLKGIVQRLTF